MAFGEEFELSCLFKITRSESIAKLPKGLQMHEENNALADSSVLIDSFS